MGENNYLKCINIALVGDPGSGKTFIMESLARFFYENYNPIISNRYRLIKLSDNGIGFTIKNRKIKIQDQWINNSPYMVSPSSLCGDVESKIHNPPTNQTQLSTSGIPEVYASVIMDGKKESFFITFYNIPGEAFNPFFERLHQDLPPTTTPFTIICKKHVHITDTYWEHNPVESNFESWDAFENEVSKILRDHQLIRDQNFNTKMNNLKRFFLSFLYCCYATDLIYCRSGNSNDTRQLSPADIAQMKNFGDKNYYRVITKIDEYLNSELPNLRHFEHFEEFYSNMIKDFQNSTLGNAQVLDTSRINQLSTLLEEAHGGDMFSENANYLDFVASCCLYYDEKRGSRFIPLETGRWNRERNSKRRSIGVRELLSTILYNNDIPIDDLGNLKITDELLKHLYYKAKTF